MRFKVLTAAGMKLRIFWDVLQCIPEDSELLSYACTYRPILLKINVYAT
jgi:hypothetical protein